MELDLIARLNKDLKVAAVTLSPDEARYMVDAYYQIQEYRKASANQHRSLAKSGEPNSVIGWLMEQDQTLENQIKRVLDAWTDGNPIGEWAKSIVGIGPVISAGLLAHIDIVKAPTVGHIWRFAGLDSTQQWLGREQAGQSLKRILESNPDLDAAVTTAATLIGCQESTLRRYATTDAKKKPVKLSRESLTRAMAKRPWNAGLKTLCWKIGESFVKVQNLPGDFYGQIYRQRKDEEIVRNEAGEYSAQAKAKLERFKIGKDTEAFAAYSAGRLPAAHIHARAKRYAVKLFLAHYHHVAWKLTYGTEPPKPYVIEHMGHAHIVGPPNFSQGVR